MGATTAGCATGAVVAAGAGRAAGAAVVAGAADAAGARMGWALVQDSAGRWGAGMRADG